MTARCLYGTGFGYGPGFDYRSSITIGGWP